MKATYYWMICYCACVWLLLFALCQLNYPKNHPYVCAFSGLGLILIMNLTSYVITLRANQEGQRE